MSVVSIISLVSVVVSVVVSFHIEKERLSSFYWADYGRLVSFISVGHVDCVGRGWSFAWRVVKSMRRRHEGVRFKLQRGVK
jgi:hypothetical protein